METCPRRTGPRGRVGAQLTARLQPVLRGGYLVPCFFAECRYTATGMSAILQQVVMSHDFSSAARCHFFKKNLAEALAVMQQDGDEAPAQQVSTSY